MPRIPIYERQTAPQGPPLPGMEAGAIREGGGGLAALGGGLQRLQAGLEDYTLQRDVQAAREREDDAALAVAQQISNGRAYWLEEVKRRSDTFDPASGSLQAGALKDYDAWSSEQAKAAPTTRSRRFLQERLLALREDVGRETFLFERNHRIERNVAAFRDGLATDAKTLYTAPHLRGEVLGTRIAAVSALEGVGPEVKQRMMAEVHRDLNLAVETGELERDPRRWYKERFGRLPWTGGGGAAGGAGASGSADVREFVFPMRIDDATRRWIAPVNAAAEKHGVDQNVLLAQIQQESRGNPVARSKAGAVGVAQFMEETAARYGLKDRTDPLASIDAQARHMAGLLRRFDGDYDKALAGYNGGERRVDEAVRRAGKSGGSWVDYLPQETRDYVKIVSENVRPSAAGGGGSSAVPAAPAAATSDPSGREPISWLALAADTQERLRAQAERTLQQQAVAGLGALRERVQNAQALAQAGHADPVPIQDAEFEAAGLEGARLQRSYQRSQALATRVAGFRGAPTSEIVAAVRAATPRPTTEGFAEEQAGFRVAAAAAQADLEARAKDPAAYVLEYSTPVGSMWRELQRAVQSGSADARGLAQGYAGAVLEEQRRLEVEQPRLVPQAYVDQVVRLFQTGDGAQNAGEAVRAMEAVWGRHWPRIAAQAGKDLPAAAVVLSDVDSPAVREQVSRVAAMSLNDLKNGLDPKDVTAAFQVGDRELQSLRLALDPTGNGAVVYSKYEDVVRRLTLSNMRGGMAPGDAAKDAYDRLVGDKYEFRGASSNPYAVPKAERADEVERGTSVVLADLGKVPLKLPADRLGAGTIGELPAVVIRAQYVDQIRNNAVWVRTPDDDGLALYAKGADGRLRAVEAADGRALRFTWSRLRQAALDRSMTSWRESFGVIGGQRFLQQAPAAEPDGDVGFVAP